MPLKQSKSNSITNAKNKTKTRKQYVPRSFLECQSLTHVVGFPPQNELVTTLAATDFVKKLVLDRFVKEIVKPYQPDKTTRNDNTADDPTGGSQSAATPSNDDGYYHVMVGGKLVKKRRVATDKTQSNKTHSKKAKSSSDGIEDEAVVRKKRIWKENILIGTNQCLRLLETLDANSSGNDSNTKTTTEAILSRATLGRMIPNKPSLIVLAKDVYPPTMLCAVPVLAKRQGIPLLLLPGKASMELGKALNAKRTSIVIFCYSGDSNSTTDSVEGSSTHAAMASFVSFVLEQIPRNTN